MFRRFIVVCGPIFLSMAGCATVTRGTSEVLVIETDPPGADVDITPANQHCKTPCSAKVRRKDNQMVVIRREGYEAVQVNVQPQIAGAGAAGMAGNVILGGLIGVAIDAASGATKELKPNPIKVTLVSLTKPVSTAPVAPVAPVEAGPAVAPAAEAAPTTIAVPKAVEPDAK